MEASVPSKKYSNSFSNFVKDCSLWLSWSWFFRQSRAVIVLAALGTLSYLLVSHFGFQPIRVVGMSMYPTLANSGCYWLNRFVYVVDEPQQNDIVAIRDPKDYTLEVKRIVATPKQSIYLKNGKVYVNGRLLHEPYLPAGMPTYAYEKSEDEFYCIGKDAFFVLGDNRNNSRDSRSFGAVPRKNILGKVME
jgi:signal peptidase I